MIPILDALLPFAGKILDKVIPDPEAKAKAQAELAVLQQNGELARMANETELFKTEQNNLTERLKADMGSDSWLSKNIRPMTLIFILAGYFTFAMMSAFGKNTNENYVELLGQWGMLIMSFYFGGRTLEKIIDMRSKVK
jgi:Holin of 3TMs, for gene-transfer release